MGAKASGLGSYPALTAQLLREYDILHKNVFSRPKQSPSLALARSLALSLSAFSSVKLKRSTAGTRESSFIDNLLVRIHLIIVMISVDRPCAMEV
jgi:hypothetical protein